MTLRGLISTVFNPTIWSLIFGGISLVLMSQLLIFGGDISLPISRFICPSCGYTSSAVSGHYRTILLYSLLGSYAMFIYRDVFKNHLLAVYLGSVTVLGDYGLSEFLYAFPQALSGYTLLGNFITDLFYWCLYLFQILILYLFTSGEIKATDKIWSGNTRVILLLFVVSLVFYIASFISFFIGLSVDMTLLFALNYIHKVILTSAFVVYLRGWKR